MRPIHARYEDPLDLVWRRATRRMGMRVARSAEVNASWDGAGTLTVGAPETLDPDDCLAQMVLHEVCHALVEGPESLARLDWGLRNEPDATPHEHAALRLQAALADTVGLRRFFAATTVFRRFYDALPADPFGSVGGADAEDPSIAMAREGWVRATTGPWSTPLADALRVTAAIHAAVCDAAGNDSLWARATDGSGEPPSEATQVD